MKSQCHLWKLVMRKMGNESPRCKCYILLLGSMWHTFLDGIGLQYSTWTYCVRYTYVIWTPVFFGCCCSLRWKMVMHFASRDPSQFQGSIHIKAALLFAADIHVGENGQAISWTSGIWSAGLIYGGSYLSKLRYAALNIRDSWVNNLASFESSRKIDVSPLRPERAIVSKMGNDLSEDWLCEFYNKSFSHSNWSWTIYRHVFQRSIL